MLLGWQDEEEEVGEACDMRGKGDKNKYRGLVMKSLGLGNRF
jgi:hypothetical protein